MTSQQPFSEPTAAFPPPLEVADPVAALETTLALHELRKTRAVTQEALAVKLAVGRPAVCKLERRADMHVSNLRRYVEALGGALEIIARFPDRTVTIAEVGEAEAAVK